MGEYIQNSKDNFTKLTDTDGVSRSCHDRVGARERLSAGLQRGDVQGGRDAFVVDEVLEEQVEVAREVRDGRSGNKGVNSGITVRARVELEGVAPDGSGSDGRPRAGDGPGAAVCREPDHDFIFVRASGGTGKPQVI